MGVGNFAFSPHRFDLGIKFQKSYIVHDAYHYHIFICIFDLFAKNIGRLAPKVQQEFRVVYMFSRFWLLNHVTYLKLKKECLQS